MGLECIVYFALGALFGCVLITAYDLKIMMAYKNLLAEQTNEIDELRRLLVKIEEGLT